MYHHLAEGHWFRCKLTCVDEFREAVFTTRRKGYVDFAADWDLLLCSAGSLSAILCEHTRQAGRNVVDIGALDMMILQKAAGITE